MLKSQDQILLAYSQKLNDITLQINQTQKFIDRLSLFRIGLFLLEILFFVLLLQSADNGWRLAIQLAMIVPVLCFVFIVRKQSFLDKELDYKKRFLWVIQNEINILNNKENGYDNGKRFESESHPYTSDLDIFGDSSLFALLNRCSTQNGNHLLANTLSVKSNRANILLRQEAVKEIALKIEETYAFRANLRSHDINKIEQIKIQLQNQLDEQLSFVNNNLLKFYVRLVPFVTIGLILAVIFLGGYFDKILALFLVFNTGLIVFLTPKINKVFYCFGGSSGLLNSYSSAIEWTENQNWKSTYILSLFDSKIPVSKEIKSLSKIIQKFDARLNLLVGGILNGLFLWDLSCCISLSQWHQFSSKDVISALNHLGDFEELIALATLSYNQPDWVFPNINTSFELKASEIGHPLIVAETRVSNNFNVSIKPTVDIITGSNMAGKSTFLRTLGINMILAYTGAPVCAKEMSLSVFSIKTYMRIKDSLNESTSTFKAELNRLKMILENVVSDRDTFVLIDEMLRGTNSRDKYLGSKVFIEKLISEKTPALFATHDLQLADLEDNHAEALRNFHFDIQLANGEMKFDYKLKHGACKTFNAAILLKEIGLSLN
jgi:hypothetical protein